MEVRELREKDRAGLSRLIADVERELPEAMNFRSDPGPRLIADVVEWKIGAVRSGAMADFVAVDGGRVVADCEILCGCPNGVVGIIVDRDHRRRGVGREILERCLARARELGVRTVDAKVMASNSRAIAFFRKMGFEEKGRVAGGAVLMSRDLP
jgi:ribosomal protein S18 acetylase RimI-like enzyme